MKLIIYFALLILFIKCDTPPRYIAFDQTVPIFKGVELIPGRITIKKGESFELRFFTLNSDGTKTELNTDTVEISCDSPIISISSLSVTAVDLGTARITATANGISAESTVTVIDPPDYSKLVISEILCAPSGGTDEEFIEIYNQGENPCRLSGTYIVDGSISSIPFIFTDQIIAPKSFFTIAKSKESFYAKYGIEPDASVFSFTLNNTKEAVFLKNPNGSIIDSIYTEIGSADYPAPESWGALITPAGNSLKRKDPDIDTDSASDFEPAEPSPGSK